MIHKYRIGVDIGNTSTKINLNNNKLLIIEKLWFFNGRAGITFTVLM